MALRRPRTRQVVIGVIGGLVLGLGAGPVRASFVDGQAEKTRVASPAQADDPAPRRRGRSPVEGIWDTTGTAMRPLPEPRLLSVEQAVQQRPAPDSHVVLSGTPGRRSLPGVGVVVTRQDRARVTALGEVPAGLDVLQQVSPRRLARTGVTASVGTQGTLEAVVLDEIASRITSGSALVAGRVVSDVDGPGLLEPRGSGLGISVRGLAYVVAAHAVPPGSRRVPVTTEATDVSVLAFAHGGGGGSLLAYNPSTRRRLVVDLLVGDVVNRYTLRIAPGSLTALVLPSSSVEAPGDAAGSGAD